MNTPGINQVAGIGPISFLILKLFDYYVDPLKKKIRKKMISLKLNFKIVVLNNCNRIKPQMVSRYTDIRSDQPTALKFMSLSLDILRLPCRHASVRLGVGTGGGGGQCDYSNAIISYNMWNSLARTKYITIKYITYDVSAQRRVCINYNNNVHAYYNIIYCYAPICFWTRGLRNLWYYCRLRDVKSRCSRSNSTQSIDVIVFIFPILFFFLRVSQHWHGSARPHNVCSFARFVRKSFESRPVGRKNKEINISQTSR